MTMTTESTEAIEATEVLTPEIDPDETVVDSFEASEEEARQAALVKTVSKIVAKPAKTKQSGAGDVPGAEGKVDHPDDSFQVWKDRATEAGIPESLAERLHEGGMLEEALAAFDRRLIEQGKPDSKQDDPKPDKASVKPDRGGKDDGGLDPDEFDERLVKVVDALRAEIAQLKGGGGDRFQKWFDGEVAGLKNEKLFSDAKNRELLRDGYERICEARGVDPGECHSELLKRAYPAMFQDEVFKAAQRETVQRLRDAEGRFLKPTRASGSPPLHKKLTEEEAHANLMKQVGKILSR